MSDLVGNSEDLLITRLIYLSIQMKKTIVPDMGDVSGKIKLLFATEAYGMGADAPDVRRIVHIGPPTSLESKICCYC